MRFGDIGWRVFSFGCMAIVLGAIGWLFLWPFLQNWQQAGAFWLVVIAFVVVSVLLVIAYDRFSRSGGNAWLREHVVTSGWMTLFFLGLLLMPVVLPKAMNDALEPWRFWVVAVLAWLLYWFKHPTEFVRGVAVGSLVLIGFELDRLLPQEFSREIATTDSEGEEGTTSFATMLAVPLMLVALAIATDLDRKNMPVEREPKGPIGFDDDGDGDGGD